ncbi:unnamed protein product, partial [Polarella glacialis]
MDFPASAGPLKRTTANAGKPSLLELRERNRRCLGLLQSRRNARHTSDICRLENGTPAKAEVAASVVVVARVRPRLGNEAAEAEGVEVLPDGQSLVLTDGSARRQFALDQVFDSRRLQAVSLFERNNKNNNNNNNNKNDNNNNHNNNNSNNNNNDNNNDSNNNNNTNSNMQ